MKYCVTTHKSFNKIKFLFYLFGRIVQVLKPCFTVKIGKTCKPSLFDLFRYFTLIIFFFDKKKVF